jgi:acetylglutamate kinase
VGLHGASGHTIRARRRSPRPVDLGLVGDVVGFNLDLLADLQRRGSVPVLACLGCDDEGNVLNINADVVAAALAAALRADVLVMVTSTPGVLQSSDQVVRRLTRAELTAGLADGTIHGGMIPKLIESFAVLDRGVGSVVVAGALGPGDLVRAVLEPGSVGTSIGGGGAAPNNAIEQRVAS